MVGFTGVMSVHRVAQVEGRVENLPRAVVSRHGYLRSKEVVWRGRGYLLASCWTCHQQRHLDADDVSPNGYLVGGHLGGRGLRAGGIDAVEHLHVFDIGDELFGGVDEPRASVHLLEPKQ